MNTNPRFVTPNDDQEAPDSPEVSFAEEMGAIVDDAMALISEFGLRPYRVWIVTVRWDGGEVGVGEPSVVRERELLPTPWVDTRPIYTEMRSGGRVEQGTIRLREISPRYTEDDLRGAPGEGEQVFVEIRHDSRDGSTERRRYSVRGQPWRNAEEFEWSVTLGTEQQARERDGTLAEAEAQVYLDREQI